MKSWTMVCFVVVVLAGCAGRRAGERLPGVPPQLPSLSVLREFVIPWPDAFPSDIAVDSTGRVWFTDRLTHVIGMFDPATEEFRRYPTPTVHSAPYGLIAAPDGTLWFCESRLGRLGSIDPATGRITEHAIPGATGGPHLLAWREGEIWFSMREGRGFGRFDPHSGESTLYRLEQERPYSVTVTAEAVWLSSYGAFRLLQVDPETGAVRVHDLSTLTPMPPGVSDGEPVPERERNMRVWRGEVRRILSEPDGAIWFTDFARGRIMRYDPAASGLTAFESLERQSEPYGLARSRAGHVWYSERGAGRITLLDPARDERARTSVSGAPTHARHIVLDEVRGRAWFPLSDAGRIGLISYR
jgi:virginiamycin B lyase